MNEWKADETGQECSRRSRRVQPKSLSCWGKKLVKIKGIKSIGKDQKEKWRGELPAKKREDKSKRIVLKLTKRRRPVLTKKMRENIFRRIQTPN